MEIKIDKSFQKDTRKIKDKALLSKIANIIFSVQQADNIKQIKNIKRIKSTSKQYRIKLGDYRLGIIISGSTIEFIRCLHRKDIYRYFPK